MRPMNRPTLLATALVAGIIIAAIPAGGFAAGGRAGIHTRQKAQTGGSQVTLPDAAFVASVVGVTTAVLQHDLAAGQTVLHIAGTRFASADTLATALLAPMKHKLDIAASSGKVPAQAPADAYAQAHAAYVRLVVTPHPALAAATTIKTGAPQGNGDDVVQTVLAAQCNTTVSALNTAFAAGGRTPLAICMATNSAVTQDSLVSALVNALAGQLGYTPTAQERTDMTTKITRFLTTPLSPDTGASKP